MLNLSSLENAVLQLSKSLDYYSSDLANGDPDIKKQFRMAAIQAFEYNYELAHKMLRRYLTSTEPSAQTIEEMSFAELIRTGSERNLLMNGWDRWKVYREIRNITTHTYDALKAEKAMSVIPAFLIEVQHFLHKLKAKQSGL